MTPSQIINEPMLFAEDTVDINFWVILKQNKNYEISNVSLIIRCVKTKREAHFSNNKGGINKFHSMVKLTVIIV
jgi:hypothetical protein